MRPPVGTASVVIALLGGLAGCDWIGDPWVSDREQYTEDRGRADELRERLIDRAERGQRDR